MSFFFLDTSAVVKRYFQEHGSAWVQSLTNPANSHTLVIAEITIVETAAAISARHRAPGGISLQEHDDLISLFIGECDTNYDLVSVTRDIVDQAARLTQIHRLRGYDAVQLASGLFAQQRSTSGYLSQLTFVTADNGLIAAAQAEGLAVANPNDYG